MSTFQIRNLLKSFFTPPFSFDALRTIIAVIVGAAEPRIAQRMNGTLTSSKITISPAAYIIAKTIRK